GRGDAGVGVAHGGAGDAAALEDEAGLDAEERRPPQHQVGQLADLDRAHDMGDAMRACGGDGVLGHVALDGGVVEIGRGCSRGRGDVGSSVLGVGMLAWGPPMAALAMLPPLRMRLGLTPKNAGRHSTRSASLPTSTEPTTWAMPCVRAGLMVYLAT